VAQKSVFHSDVVVLPFFLRRICVFISKPYVQESLGFNTLNVRSAPRATQTKDVVKL